MDTTPFEPMASLPAAPPRQRWGVWSTLAWGLGGGLVMVGTQTLGAILYVALFDRSLIQAGRTSEAINTNGPLIAFAFLVSLPFVLGYFALAVRLARVSFVDYLAIKWPRWWHVVVGIAIVITVLAISGLAADASGQEMPAFMTGTFATARDAGILPLFILSFVVIAPMEEEILFRGFLFRGLVPRLGTIVTIVLTAVIWSIVHLQYNWFFVGEIFLLGLTFGWLRWWSGSLILTFLLHAANNGSALIAIALMNGDPG
jgi:CAAX protease family protein